MPGKPLRKKPRAAAARLPLRAVDALLALSRGLAAARDEEELTGALAKGLAALFPGRAFAVRLLHPRTLALTTFYARGALRAGARDRVVLRRRAVLRTGLSPEALEAGGVTLADVDASLFERAVAASAVPLAASGQLFGILNLEYPPAAPGDPRSDAPILKQVANHAALAIRNLRSIEELTFLKTYLEDLIQHANALILAVSRRGEVMVWNGELAALTGVDRADALGRPLLDRVVPEDRPTLRAALEATLAGDALDGLPLRLARAGGGEAPVVINTAPIHGATAVEGVLAIGQDLGPLRSAQAAAEHAERLAGIGRLVAGVVHELNNPLTAVTMYAESLIEKATVRGGDPADLEKLKAILEGGQRIQRLSRDLVTYARPTGSATEPVELAGVLDEALRLSKPVLKERGAVVVREPGQAPPVQGNRPSLVQVVLALVTNAAQAVAPGGEVRVGLSAAEGQARITVADAGAGMTPDVAARAFEPFFTTKTAVGIGLGLPIVQGIVQRHGGTVALTSEAGKGTVVTVTLPVG